MDKDGIKVALMGFGRIGRNLFRQLRGHPFLEVGAIADPADPVGLAYLLQYDSIYGRFPEPVSYREGYLITGEQRTPLLGARDPGETDWTDLEYPWWCRPPDATAPTGSAAVISPPAPGEWCWRPPPGAGDIPILLRE